jgi:hypothetical protein
MKRNITVLDNLKLYRDLVKTLKTLRSTDQFVANAILADTEDMLMDIMDDVWYSLTPEQVIEYNKSAENI